MSFLSRFGWSLTIFGLVTLVAPLFGYAPRKLASFDPGQLRIAGLVFLIGGIVCLLVDLGPRVRKAAGVVLVSLLALAVVGAAALGGYGWYRKQSGNRPRPPLAEAAMPAVTPPSAIPHTQGPRPESPTKPGSPTAVTPPPSGTIMDSGAYYRSKRQLEQSFGRERLWEVVVHLGPREQPASLTERLTAFAASHENGRALVCLTGSVLHACVSPLDDGSLLEAELRALFPAWDVRRMGKSRDYVVFPPHDATPAPR